MYLDKNKHASKHISIKTKMNDAVNTICDRNFQYSLARYF